MSTDRPRRCASFNDSRYGAVAGETSIVLAVVEAPNVHESAGGVREGFIDKQALRFKPRKRRCDSGRSELTQINAGHSSTNKPPQLETPPRHSATRQTVTLLFMADARALLKAKRLERGAGSGSKTKTASTVGRAAKTDSGEHLLRKGKRKLAADESIPAASPSPRPDVDEDMSGSGAPSDKRRRIEDEDRDSPASGGGGFPADFFSDPSRSLPTADGDDDDEEAPSLPMPTPSAQPTAKSQPTSVPPSSNVEDEYAAFERAIQASAQSTKRAADVKAFSSATITAEPELVRTDANAGFPPSSSSDERRPPPPAADGGPTEEEVQQVEERQRKQEEEQELIMDRLVDEERAQEDADAKVNALKARLEAIKLKRAAKKEKAGGGPS